ncbi:glycosyltransferase family 4 protein [Cupriavidus sp. L7L]|uniref:glycosyltransferase family 4 protein n=1 Tax=Cupriavidus sp. L7L TaxID=2546443 RepID=UPI0010549F6F|nr:glycosyltransferase family 4 protein [Cupriavidus sp. L7L]TDF67700.1 glycosyltransferase [Cupriavidus sp. L7L]
MRVLQVFKTYYPDSFGGVEQVIRQIATSGPAYGVTSKVFAPSHFARDVRVIHEDGVEVIQVPCTVDVASTPFSVSALGPFREALRWADVVHYHFPWPFADILHALGRPAKPALATYHSDIVRQKVLLQLYKPLQRRFLDSMQAIVATSPNYVETSPTLQRYKDKVSVIPIGLNESAYPRPDSRRVDAWRGRVGEGFFLFVGVIRYYKGLHILLDALGPATRSTNRNVRVVIVGSGPIESDLRRQAAELKLDNVQFLGALPEEDKIALLQLCLAVVFPSHLRSEAYGITLVEGAMSGKPLISAEIGTGSSFVNIHEKTGLVVPPRDPQALRLAMDRLATHPEEVERMGREARRRFETIFTADRMTLSYADLYQTVCGNARLLDSAGARATKGMSVPRE